MADSMTTLAAIAEKLGGTTKQLRAGLCITLGNRHCPTFSRLINSEDAEWAVIRAAEAALTGEQRREYAVAVMCMVERAMERIDHQDDFWFQCLAAPASMRVAALATVLGVEGC